MKPVLVFTYNKVICSVTATCSFGALVSVYVYAAVIVFLLVLMIMLLLQPQFLLMLMELSLSVCPKCRCSKRTSSQGNQSSMCPSVEIYESCVP